MFSPNSALILVTLLVAGSLLLALLSFPTNFENNLPSLLFLSCAWILAEIDSIVVLRSLLLALLEGEIFHRILRERFTYSRREVWISIFACGQEAFVARLVWKLFVVMFISKVLWEQLPVEAERTRSLPAYWEEIRSPVSLTWRRDWGNVLQLMVTRRLYEMLSQRGKREVELARLEFLRDGDRDKFTLAVLSALSKQGTFHVLQSTQTSTKLQAMLQQMEEKLSTLAWNQLNRHTNVFATMKLPAIIDPAGGSTLRFACILTFALLVHKRMFKFVKLNIAFGWLSHSKPMLFVCKQTSRYAMISVLLGRFLLGGTAGPNSPSL